MNEKLTQIGNSMKAFAKSTQNKVYKTMDLVRKKSEISEKKAELEHLYTLIGKAYCAGVRTGQITLDATAEVHSQEESADLMKKMQEHFQRETVLLEELAAMEQELDEIKARTTTVKKQTVAEETIDSKVEKANPQDPAADTLANAEHSEVISQ